jgi:hypothetical protein
MGFIWRLTFLYNVSVPRQVQAKPIITIPLTRCGTYTVTHSVVPINSSLLTITLNSSAITTSFYTDTKYSVSYMAFKTTFTVLQCFCSWEMLSSIYILRFITSLHKSKTIFLFSIWLLRYTKVKWPYICMALKVSEKTQENSTTTRRDVTIIEKLLKVKRNCIFLE